MPRKDWRQKECTGNSARYGLMLASPTSCYEKRHDRIRDPRKSSRSCAVHRLVRFTSPQMGPLFRRCAADVDPGPWGSAVGGRRSPGPDVWRNFEHTEIREAWRQIFSERVRNHWPVPLRAESYV